MRSRIAALGCAISVLTLVGCSEEDQGRSGGAGGEGGGMTAGDAPGAKRNISEICEDVTVQMQSQTEEWLEDYCRGSGFQAAWAGFFVDGEMDEAKLRDACGVAYDGCLLLRSASADTIAASCANANLPASCDFPDEELKTCLSAMNDATAEAGGSLPACSDIKVEDLEELFIDLAVAECSEYISCTRPE